jgi:YVTN family beta-propeller protein
VRFTPNGAKAYVAALGSNKLGVLDGTTATVTGRVAVGQGPWSGLAMAADGARLYVLNRFDNTISIVAPASDAVVATVPLGFDPTPAVIRNGRPFLYDAALTSGHGDAVVRLLPRVRQPRRHRLGPGQPAGQLPGSAAEPDVRRAAAGLPPDEGPDDDADAARPRDVGLMHWRADRAGFTPSTARSSA